MKLTQEQLKQFNEDGFLILKDFADPVLCEEILNSAKDHLIKKVAPIESEAEYLEAKTDSLTIRRLRQVFDREDVFKAWMTHEKMKPILEQVLGENPVLVLAHHNSIMTKMPKQSSRTSWHQDFRYWNYTTSDMVSVWLSLDDETLSNGLLEFIPQSHKLDFDKSRFDKRSNFLDEHEENKQLIKTAVHSNLQKGDVVLFHCKTLHHANKNTTSKEKISFVYTVRACENKPQKDTISDYKEVIL